MSTNKNYNVNLSFTADVAAAQRQLNSLQQSLTAITKSSITNPFTQWTPEIQEATQAAVQLKFHLEKATNMDTGTLDFSKLNQSIKQSGSSLVEYGRKLQSLGPQGQQAFMQLAGAVAQSEVPIRRVNATLQSLMVTLKNTAKWQLSSSMLHGFMSAVSSAFNYAQDLNSALSDIRIVTDQSAEQMSRFAEQANRAARALSTTTTEYAKASLIYYQQGLSDSEVEARTNVTIKMANAAGESAQKISDQLTAVWNNFYDGSKSLEYYADVMTALGAATASSTDEIAGGLEKFAAIGNTIGLSYEYAASALATITSNTRQSEEVVGTALKTIFARIQGLNLGDTLEDGTTLNKYSEALKKVGISIFDSAGELKKMDNILDEMGAKWGTLSKDQQTALAQTVAGVRQYTQLIALMENWNKTDADSMASNLKTAYGSTGTLDKQADIYAESWEAAQARVKAAAEDVYDSLIDKDFFIDMLKGVETLLGGLSTLIDSLGGVKGVLSSIAMIATKVFAGQMAQGVRNFAFNLKASTEAGRAQIEQQKIQTLATMGEDMAAGANLEGSRVGKIAARQYEQQLALQRELTENSKNMTDAEIQAARQLLDIRSQITEEVIEAATRTEAAKSQVSDDYMRGLSEMYAAKPNAPNNQNRFNEYTIQTSKLKNNEQALNELSNATRNYAAAIQDAEADADSLENIITSMTQAFQKSGMSEEQATEKARQLSNALNESGGSYEDMVRILGQHSAELLQNSANAQNQLRNLGLSEDTIQALIHDYHNLSDAERRELQIKIEAEMAQKRTSAAMAAHKKVIKDYADGIVAGAQALTSFASICQAASGMLDALTNPDLSGWEKFVQVMSSLGSVVMSTVFLFSSLATMYSQLTAGTLTHAAASLVDFAAESLLTKAKKNSAIAAGLKERALSEENEELKENIVLNTVDTASSNKNGKSQLKLGDSFKKLGTNLKNVIGASKGLIAAYAAIAAGVLVVVGGIALAINQYNAHEQAVKEAEESAQKLADAYTSVKSAYDQFASTIDNYKSLKDGMAELTKGTAEYNDQLYQANEQAIELIKNHKELAGKYKIEGGLIVIDDAALEQAQNEELSRLGKVQASQIFAQGQVAEAEVERQRTEFNRDMYSAQDVGWGATNTAAAGGVGLVGGALIGGGVGYKIGAGIGTAIAPGIGTAIGVILGGIVGVIGGAITGAISSAVGGIESQAEVDAIDAVVEHYSKTENQGMFASEEELKKHIKALVDNGKISKNVGDNLLKNKEALEELTKVEYARLQQERNDWELQFGAYNMGNEAYTNADSQNYLNAAGYEYAHDSHTVSTVTSAVEDLWSGSNDDFWAAYLREVLGETTVDEEHTSGENYRIRDLGGGNVTVEKKNAEGTWEKVGEANSLSEEAAEQQLINARLMAEASGAIGDFAEGYTVLSEQLSQASGIQLEDDQIESVLTAYKRGESIDFSKSGGYSFANSIDFNEIKDASFKNYLEEQVQTYRSTLSQTYLDVYDSLSTEDQILLSTIEIDPDATEEEIREALRIAQQVADDNAIQGTITFGNKLIEFIDSNPSATEWSDEGAEGGKSLFYQWAKDAKLIKDDVKITDKAFLDEWTEFLLKTNDEKKDFVENYIGENATTGYTNTQEGMVEAEERRAQAQEYVDDGANKSNYEYSKGLEEEVNAQSEYTSDYYVEPFTTDEGGIWKLQNGEDGKAYEPEGGYYLEGRYQIDRKSGFDRDTFIYSQEVDSTAFGRDVRNKLTPSGGERNEVAQFFDAYSTGDVEEMQRITESASKYYKDILDWLSIKLINKQDNTIWETEEMPTYQINEILDYVYEEVPKADKARAEDINNTISTYESEEKIASGTDLAAEAAKAAEAQQELENYLDKFDSNIEAFEVVRDGIAEEFSQEDYATQLGTTVDQLTDDQLSDYNGLIDKIAKKHIKMDSGMQDLAENWETWNGVLSDSNSSLMDLQEVVPEVKKAIAKILDVDIDVLPADFVQDNWDVIQQVYNGVDGAIEDLAGRLAAAQLELNIKPNLKTESAIAAYDELYNFLMTDMPDLELGVSLDEAQMTEVFQALLDSGAVTQEQMTDILSNIGFKPDITYETIPVQSAVQSEDGATYTVQYVDADGVTQTKTVAADMYHTTDTGAEIRIPVINGSKTTYEGGSTYKPRINTKKGGGSKKEPKKLDRMKESDLGERYKEIDDALDDLRDTMEDTNKEADRMYGAGRIVQMQKYNKMLLKEIDLLKEKKKQAKEFLKLDKRELDRAASEVGVSFSYDENGNVVNYNEQLTALRTEYNDRIDAINAKGGANEQEEKEIEELNEKRDELKEAYQQYEETREAIEDFDNEIDDKFYEWQDNNFEMWNHSLEISIDVTDDFKEVLDTLLSRTEGDFFKQAEGLALMGGQLAMVNVEMGSYIGHLGVLGGLMATNSISPADFVEGLGQVKDGAFAAAQAIFELDEQMIHYYGNALDMAREKIDFITDQLSHGTSVLEHYLSLMDLMGHQTDYKNRGIVLEGRVKTLKNELDALQLEADYMNEEAEKKKQMLDRAILPTSAEVFKQQYEDALSAAMETQEEFLSKAEEYAQALNEQLENSLNAANQDLEDALTGGKSFDQLITGMERVVSLQEEYLTNTNKIYETEKLMNKAQQEIDKTTNTVAKQKLKQFIAETDQLKEKNKLSKFELDVQQAKYELLLAEIALEEAQNAKSQVRLQRDKEGNFGYVYTADSSAIADAEQELADKQNEFYNIALEGINTYAEKYAQTLQEMYDTLTEIDQQYHEGAFASEDEYLAAREAAMTYYYDKLGQYSELYNIAIQLDSNATADAWGSDYEDMVNSTEQWKTATKAHADTVKATFGEWKTAMDLLASQTSTRMDQLASSVEKVTEESDSLYKELKDDLMPQIEKEMSLVSQLTALYAALRIVVLGLAYAYMSLGVAMTFCQMAASMGSMLSALDFGEATDALTETAGALSGKISGEEASTNSGDSQKSEKKTIDLEKGHAIFDYIGAPQESLISGGTYDVLEERGDYLVVGQGGIETGKIKKPEGWATGGYTGEWGSYGKLAMLHEKELVLNAKDTENFLASMDLLNNIVSTIDLHAANQSLGGMLNSPGLGTIESETLEQTVTIEANFPGVSSRTEIEEAFSTLVNRASQYANRK